VNWSKRTSTFNKAILAPLAPRTRLPLAPVVVYDSTQPVYHVAGVLACTTLQRDCCESVTMPQSHRKYEYNVTKKPEVHNVLKRRHRRTEPRQHGETNFVMLGRVVRKITRNIRAERRWVSCLISNWQAQCETDAGVERGQVHVSGEFKPWDVVMWGGSIISWGHIPAACHGMLLLLLLLKSYHQLAGAPSNQLTPPHGWAIYAVAVVMVET